MRVLHVIVFLNDWKLIMWWFEIGVTTKPYLAPSGDKHDYMSFSP